MAGRPTDRIIRLLVRSSQPRRVATTRTDWNQLVYFGCLDAAWGTGRDSACVLSVLLGNVQYPKPPPTTKVAANQSTMHKVQRDKFNITRLMPCVNLFCTRLRIFHSRSRCPETRANSQLYRLGNYLAAADVSSCRNRTIRACR